MKQSFRIALLLTTGTLLRLSIAFFILLATIITLYSNRSYAYKVLDATRTYERFPLVILNNSAGQQLGQDETTQLGSEVFAPIVLEAAPPEVTKLAAQEIIRAHYDWIEGKQEDIRFTIDLTSSKDAIVNGITNYALDRYSTLAPCSGPVSGYDFFSVPCQIEGLDLVAQEENLRSQLENTPILLRETVYTQDSLLTDATGRHMNEYAPWIRSLYQNRSILLTSTGLIIILLIAINLIGASTFIKGVRRVGKILTQGSSGFAITALILFILLPLFGFSITQSQATNNLSDWQAQTYDALFNDIISYAARDFIMRGFIFSLPFILIGAGAWLFGSYQLEKERHTGVSYVGRSIKASLERSGLVSSEPKSKNKSKKRKKEHELPIASSEIRATHKPREASRQHKSRTTKSKRK